MFIKGLQCDGLFPWNHPWCNWKGTKGKLRPQIGISLIAASEKREKPLIGWSASYKLKCAQFIEISAIYKTYSKRSQLQYPDRYQLNIFLTRRRYIFPMRIPLSYFLSA